VRVVTPRSTRRAGEDAFGMNGVVMTVLVVAILMGVIATMVMSGLFTTKKSVGRSMSSALAEAAATKLTAAMRSGLVSPADGYTLSAADLRAVSAGAEVLDHGGNPVVPDAFEDRARGFTATAPLASVHEVNSGDGEGLWQVLRIVPPRAGVSRDVLFWVRTIHGEGTGPESVGTYAITIRDTPFSSYQMVSDSDITFEANAAITGNLHANGATASRSTPVVRAAAPATCTGSPRITTTRGSVDAGQFPGCILRQNTRRTLDLARGGQMAQTIESICASAPSSTTVRCLGAAGTNSVFDVSLSSSSLTWRCIEVCGDSGSVPLPSASDPSVPGTVMLFRGAVNLSGATAGRVTVYSWDPRAQVPAESWIVGNVGQLAPSAAVGLVSQGDIVVQGGASPDCDVSQVNAALMSVAGRLTLPSDFTSVGIDGDPCPQISILGSVSGRQSPLLSVRNADGGGAGWATRSYSYDQRYRRTPPPMFPQAAPWSVSTSRVLPARCATTATGGTAALTDDQARSC
jgi:hypothetical protein